jgi:hypothetical protein
MKKNVEAKNYEIVVAIFFCNDNHHQRRIATEIILSYFAHKSADGGYTAIANIGGYCNGVLSPFFSVHSQSTLVGPASEHFTAVSDKKFWMAKRGK